MLAMTTIAWAFCFAAWTIFSILGVHIQQELGLSESQFGLLISTPLLTGALARLPLGIASERFGGRLMTALLMVVSALSVWMLTWAQTYAGYLLAAAGLGLSGAVFITAIAFVAAWFPARRHGSAFGVLGVGQVGAAVTNFGAPLLMVWLGWEHTARIYAAALLVMALVFWLTTRDDPATVQRKSSPGGITSLQQQLEPLGSLRVWRFGLYYFFVFGGFVALASWLPRYYIGVYGLDLSTAGMLTAVFSFSAAVFRMLGGVLSDRWGPRRVMYWTFGASLVCLFLLSYPATTYIIEGMQGPITVTISTSLPVFTLITFVLGFFMSLGMAAVYKHIPAHYPNNVGTVGGLVGMIGGLGGFFLPITFGVLNDFTTIWTTAFMALFALVAVNLTWMHAVILRLERELHPDLRDLRYLPEGIPMKELAELRRRTGAQSASR